MTHNIALKRQSLRGICQSIHTNTAMALICQQVQNVCCVHLPQHSVISESAMQVVNIPLLLHTVHSPSQNTGYICHHTEHRRNLEREEPAQDLEILLPSQRRERKFLFPCTFKDETKMGKTQAMRSFSQCLQKSQKQPSKHSFLEMLTQSSPEDEMSLSNL